MILCDMQCKDGENNQSIKQAWITIMTTKTTIMKTMTKRQQRQEQRRQEQRRQWQRQRRQQRKW